jgi:hypothetical protein
MFAVCIISFFDLYLHLNKNCGSIENGSERSMPSVIKIARSNLNEDEYLGHIDSRIDLARMEVYRQLIQAKSADDFYIEVILNIFIAVAQQPINFAFFRADGQLLFHLVSDLKYHDDFTKEIRKQRWSTCSIPFFPSLFSETSAEPPYRVLVMRMHTKTAEEAELFTPVGFPKEWELDLENKSSTHKIETLQVYLERCVFKYFIDEWDGLRTPLKVQLRDAIESSIDRRAHVFNSKTAADSWPPQATEVKRNLDQIPWRRSCRLLQI